MTVFKPAPLILWLSVPMLGWGFNHNDHFHNWHGWFKGVDEDKTVVESADSHAPAHKLLG